MGVQEFGVPGSEFWRMWVFQQERPLYSLITWFSRTTNELSLRPSLRDSATVKLCLLDLRLPCLRGLELRANGFCIEFRVAPTTT